ncbi:hypothetical protein O6H91_Y013400 [Diphasiastrum complanatum]|nr:hypothetical protein O6H91_Y013400 [Diphasiastrum complanatum]
MVIAAEPAEDYDELPSSNPLPPPPPRLSDREKRDRERQSSKDNGHGDGGGRLENLSNADFRRMVMETPRRGDEQHGRDKSRRNKKVEEEEGDGEKRAQRKFRPKPKE